MTGGCGLTADVSGRGTKRPVSDDESVEEEGAAVSKRVRDERQPEQGVNGEKRRRGTEEEHDFNLPLPWEEGLPCLVKVKITLYILTLNQAKLHV